MTSFLYPEDSSWKVLGENGHIGKNSHFNQDMESVELVQKSAI